MFLKSCHNRYVQHIDAQITHNRVVLTLFREPANGTASSFQFGPIIAAFRSCMPINSFLSAAVWSTGAYNPVSGDQWSGLNVTGLKTHGGQLNCINIMAYDAGNVPKDYNPETAFAAYRTLFKGAICLGIELGKMGWGPYLTTVDDVKNAAMCVKKDNNGGIFIWSWFQNTTGTPTVSQTLQIVNSIFN